MALFCRTLSAVEGAAEGNLFARTQIPTGSGLIRRDANEPPRLLRLRRRHPVFDGAGMELPARLRANRNRPTPFFGRRQ